MKEIYQRVAQLFAERINAIFESEATLEAEFKRNFEQLPFDRTDHWAGIIYTILRESWLDAGPEVKAEPTGYDKLVILREYHRLIDYNIFTQVLLNLQGYTGMHYLTGDATKEIARLQETWPKEFKLDPFAIKAKMVKQAEAVTEEQKQYNGVLSTLRALRIISQFTPQISFRVSPKGSTPAFADSRNISMIGQGGDKYLRTIPSLGAFYLVWDVVPHLAYFKPPATPPIAPSVGQPVPPLALGTFHAEGIPYPFVSKSGGEVLQDVLFARKLMYEIFRDVDVTQETCIMVPRMNSILVVADKYGTSLKKVVDRLAAQYPSLKLVEGARA
jgi:hypothetical protein